MSINHFPTDLPETHYWWEQLRQQQQQHIMDPNPNPNYSSSSSSIPLNNIPSPNFSPWPPHLYHHYHQQHPTRINNPYNPLPPQEPTSPSSSSMFPPPQNPNLSFNLNYQEDDEEQDQLPQASQQEHDQQVVDKEPMFEKPLTPSDVGKLNRLVIPKQHAEKYFPLSGDSVDKGLLLSFEDESGKYWRFRYSYWNSSQSYVLTKGWSRYVKEKQLDAGDVVLFERHRNDGDRLFIGWRRRGESSSSSNSGVMAQGSSGGMWSRGLYSSSSSTAGNNPQPYLGANMQQQGLGANVPYQPECLHAAGGSVAQNYGTTPKTVRLFGVNLECQLLDDESEPIPPADGSSLSLNQQLYSSSQSAAYSSSNSHMDVTLSQDVNRMRNRRGSDLWM